MSKLSPTHLVVNRSVEIPLSEIDIRAMRSSGPGGQHANKTESRIEVAFDVDASEALGPVQKQRVIGKAGRIVTAVSQDARSQTRNREIALDRLAEKLVQALKVDRKRVATKPGKAAKERRLKAKAARSETKASRRKPKFPE